MTRRVLPSFLVAALLFPGFVRAQGAPPSAAQTTTAAKGPTEPGDEDDPEGRLARKYPFRNSTFVFSQSLNALALDKDAELTYNPYYSWLFRFQPRYYITKQLSLRLRLGLSIEWTNADDTTRYHEPLWEDLWLDAVYGNVVRIPYAEIDVTPSLRFIFPTSKASQARTLYMGIGPGVTLSRGFKLPKGMGIDLAYSFRYVKNINHYATLQYDAPTIITCGGTDGEDCGRFLHSGGRNPSMSFANSFVVDWTILKRLKFEALFTITNSLLYPLTSGSATLAGGEQVDVPADPNFNVNMRAAMAYGFELSYDVHPAVSLSFGTFTLNPQLRDDAKYRAPFFNRYTEFSLTTTVNLDRVVARVHRRVRPSAE